MALTWLNDDILPTAFKSEGVKYVSCFLDNTTGKDQFSSSVVFLTVIVEKNNKTIEIPVVLKVEPSTVSVRKLINSNIQFYNEVYMYTKVLPFLEKENREITLFPNFCYGIGLISESDKNVIIVEDLRPKGYCLTEAKAYLDFEHLSLALAKLGQFHALSYAFKQKSKDDFYAIASGLQENFCLQGYRVQEVVKDCLQRAIKPLIKEGKFVKVLQKFLNRIDGGVRDLLLEIVTPDDPLAVICHGDFCRNNMLFKYTDGKPTDVRFFDIATSRVSSPAIDISFFLFMNSSKELRNTQYDELLTIYHRSLSTTVPSCQVPSLEDIKETMRKKAVWGFVHCSFFLPVMLFGCDDTMEEFSLMTDEEFLAAHINRGGEKATKVLVELAEELAQRNMFDL